MYYQVIHNVIESLRGTQEVKDGLLYEMLLSMYYVIGLSHRTSSGTLCTTRMKLFDLSHTLAESTCCRVLNKDDLIKVLEDVTAPDCLCHKVANPDIYDSDAVICMIARILIFINKLEDPDLTVNKHLFHSKLEDARKIYNRRMR